MEAVDLAALDVCLASMRPGELIACDSFDLLETVSAVELCDARMDVYCSTEGAAGGQPHAAVAGAP